MRTVMIIPTGIDCEIGGHAGDATPAARLLGAVSEQLILHPNVTNASDINEMPSNALYVEGGLLDRFLQGKIELEEVKSNKILVVVNGPAKTETVNAVSASRATLGIDAEIIELKHPLIMEAFYDKHGVASGRSQNVANLADQVREYEFDALAIATEIKCDRDLAKDYFKNGGVNPWGGIEAEVSRTLSGLLNKPVAHAPVQPVEVLEEEKNGEWNIVCDPRMSAEIISNCFLHCVLKGLHKAPRIVFDRPGLSVRNVDVLVSPMCYGTPHKACEAAGIPIIYVRDNKTVVEMSELAAKNVGGIFVQNYLEAAGLIAAMGVGISRESLQRPLKGTKVNGKS